MYGRRKLPRSFFFVSRVSKITPSPISINKGGFTGGFENDLRFVYKISTIEKTSSTYTHKNGVLRTLLRAMFTVCLQKPTLQTKNAPFSAHQRGVGSLCPPH